MPPRPSLRPSLRRAVAASTGGVLVAVSLAAAPPATATGTASAPARPAAVPADAPDDGSPSGQRPGELVPDDTAYPRQEPVPEPPDDPDDASIARGAIPYDDIAPLLNDLMGRSDRVSAEVVGTSTQGRDLYLVTVTAPESAEEVAQQAEWRELLGDDPEAAAASEELRAGYKEPVWFNANIHGNEWEGTDASLRYVEDVATSTDPAVAALLEEHRLYFTVSLNPDGRVLGQRRTALDLDPNRDFATNSTPETRAVRALTAELLPVFFTDLHGYTDVLQVEPCGPPHGEYYDYDLFIPHAYASALQIERDVVAAAVPGNPYRAADGTVVPENTGSIQIPYRDIPSGWDDWPPIFTAQYVAFSGAVTSTVELPLGRVELDPADPALDTEEEVAAASAAASAVDTEVGRIVLDSTVRYAAANADALLDQQVEALRRGAAGEELVDIPVGGGDAGLPGSPQEWKPLWGEEDRYRAELPRAFVIPAGEAQRSATDAAAVVDALLAHGIRVDRTTGPLVLDGVSHPAGSYVVDGRQPLRGLASSLLAAGSDISERVPTMYDVSAWSLGLLWGATVLPVGSSTDPALDVGVEPVAVAGPTGSAPGGDGPVALEARGAAEWRAVNAALEAGATVTALDDGSVVLDGVDAAVLADRYGVVLTEASEGAAGELLEAVTVGWTGDGDVPLALAEAGFTDLVEATPLAVAEGEADLAAVDVLYLGDGFDLAVGAPEEGLLTQEQADAASSAMAAYLGAGGDLVGEGPGANAAANAFGVWTATAVTAREDANGIVQVATPDSAAALAPYQQGAAFAYPPTWFTDLSEGVAVEQAYGEFVAGHWLPTEPTDEVPDPAPADQAAALGQAAAISTTTEAGSRAVVLGTAPLFRTHPKGGLSTVARALHWAAADPAGG